MNNTKLEDLISLAGQAAEMFSFNRSIGQLYGFLYFVSEAQSLDAIAAGCRMSKGNASIHLRTLEQWGAVTRSWKPGTRKDYYAANRDLRGLAWRRLQEGTQKRLAVLRREVDGLKKSVQGNGIKERVSEVDAILKELESGLALVPKLMKLKNLF